MKVILTQDVKAQGKKGDLINVSDGYARNFLLPRKLAVQANESNMNTLREQKEAERRRKDAELENSNALARSMQELVVTVTAKGGSAGRLFGSITTKEIADALKEQHNIVIDKRKIVLEDSIKMFGRYTLDVKLHQGVTGKLQVDVCQTQ